MISSEDKLCAFIRWSWYDTARNHLNDQERLRLYETILAYQFADEEPAADLPPMVAMLFDMIKPTLSADKQKMQHRREVAQQNGVLGGRPRGNKNTQEVSKPSWINENPVGYSGLPIYKYKIQIQETMCLYRAQKFTRRTHRQNFWFQLNFS